MGPQKIICMTEESVEVLFALGKQDLIAGVSAYVRRPPQARQLPTISAFTHANLRKICDLSPDLVLGFSDIQKDIAKDLIEAGLNVFIANHRSIAQMYEYVVVLGSIVGARNQAIALVEKMQRKVDEISNKAQKLSVRPKIYFEEWDEPMISAIQWVSECIEICGGIEIFSAKSTGSLAKERFVTHDEVRQLNPDLFFACWCGKPADIAAIKAREGYEQINAISKNNVFEMEPEIFLQPGPAIIVDGLDILWDHISQWERKQ